ncbi:MAG: Hsp20/alpha crystallin family protein [Rariglobus sp.]
MKLVRYTYPSFNTRQASFGSPWGGLENEIDRLFTVARGDFDTDRRLPVDLYEDKDNTYVRADLPGVDREAINIEHADGRLTISASRKSTSGESQETAEQFSRVVTVPDTLVQADQISATYENGVLTVTLPKREETKPRKVNVKIN